jgi:hypothetical protein
MKRHNPKDYIGKKFHRLTVVQFDGFRTKSNSKYSEPYYQCKCICGNKVTILGYHLKNGHTQSCGCLQRERASQTSKSNQLPFGESAFNTFFSNYQRNAKKRKINFLLSTQEFNQLIYLPCYYCGDPPNTIRKTNCVSSNFIKAHGIDRINPSCAYSKDNVVTCCPTCNFMKNTMSQKDFLEKIQQICQKHKL